MFLIEVFSGNLLFNFMPESGALLLCGVSLIGGAVVFRRLFKFQEGDKNLRNNETGEDEKSR